MRRIEIARLAVVAAFGFVQGLRTVDRCLARRAERRAVPPGFGVLVPGPW